jgi:hypothetical protein
MRLSRTVAASGFSVVLLGGGLVGASPAAASGHDDDKQETTTKLFEREWSHACHHGEARLVADVEKKDSDRAVTDGDVTLFVWEDGGWEEVDTEDLNDWGRAGFCVEDDGKYQAEYNGSDDYEESTSDEIKLDDDDDHKHH